MAGSWAEPKSGLTHGPTGLPPTPCLCACMPMHKCRRHRPRPATAIFVGLANRVPRCHGLHVFGWGGPRRKPPTGGLSKHPSNQCATKLPGRPQRQPMSKLPPSLGCSTGWLPRQTPNTASWDAPTWSLVWCLACCHQQVRECQPMATHTPTHPQCQRQWAPPCMWRMPPPCWPGRLACLGAQQEATCCMWCPPRSPRCPPGSHILHVGSASLSASVPCGGLQKATYCM